MRGWNMMIGKDPVNRLVVPEGRSPLFTKLSRGGLLRNRAIARRNLTPPWGSRGQRWRKMCNSSRSFQQHLVVHIFFEKEVLMNPQPQVAESYPLAETSRGHYI